MRKFGWSAPQALDGYSDTSGQPSKASGGRLASPFDLDSATEDTTTVVASERLLPGASCGQ
jgi:hypothetical protein